MRAGPANGAAAKRWFRRWPGVLLALGLLGPTLLWGEARQNQRVQFLSLTSCGDFRIDSAGYEEWLSEEIRTDIEWDELVLSWNATVPAGTHLSFEARGLTAEGSTPFYQLGSWGEAAEFRRSVKGQKDEFGQVQTDVLILRRPASGVQVRVRRYGGNGLDGQLRFLGISLLNSQQEGTAGPAHGAAWGRVLEVPLRSQLAYEDGRGWCSPTSVSMVLAWWAEQLARPELDCDVPEVAQGVHDPTWQGTGNWSFNVAFAGRFPGLRAYVARLGDISELERWLAREVPVICSVDAVRLNGRGSEEDVGHLVVVIGFTEQGEVVVNDPFIRPGQSGRKTIPRERFASAWGHSHNTAYLIYPMEREGVH